jgi:hypothetical protein
VAYNSSVQENDWRLMERLFVKNHGTSAAVEA